MEIISAERVCYFLFVLGKKEGRKLSTLFKVKQILTQKVRQRYSLKRKGERKKELPTSVKRKRNKDLKTKVMKSRKN